MDMTAVTTLIAELIGTIAFALSGGLTAIDRRLDFFGIIVLSIITAVGGGLIRDLILGSTPPAMFVNYIYVTLAFSSAVFLLVFGSAFRRQLSKSLKIVLFGINIFDAVGLGIFTIVGMNTAIAAGYENNRFLMIFVGVVTGIGGGMLRDIFVGRTPQVLKKDVYAMAAITGAILYAYTFSALPTPLAMLLSASVVIVIRLLAIFHHWNLPVVTAEKDISRTILKRHINK